jgi:hypothetical protein
VSDSSDQTFTITVPAAKGTLWVNSTPVTGASISLDGIPKSPPYTNTTSFTSISAGPHTVELSKAGYFTVSGTYSVIKNAITKVILNLVPIGNAPPPFAKIKFTSTPQGARVFVDGRDTGILTPGMTEIGPGNHQVYVTMDGYKTPAIQIIPTSSPGTVSADFPIQKIPDVAAKVRIVPQSLNIGRKAYFVAFITLPNAYNAADVDSGSVVCEGAPALRLVRIKVFPHVFAAIFRRQDLVDISPGAKVRMNVVGTIKKTGGNVVFRGSDTIKVISTKATAKETTDDALTLNDQMVFTKFFAG